jgi:secretion/DNA translocation related TadE-like protein
VRDRGSATIFVLAFGLFLVAAGMAGAAVGVARVGRHEARTAADLGALAGARRAIEGPGVACAEAGRFVTANDAVMTACELRGLDLVIRVEVTTAAGRARAAARAGPVCCGPGPGRSAARRAEGGQDGVEDRYGGGLVEGVVAVAALR